MKALYSNFVTTQKGAAPNLSSIVSLHARTQFLRPFPDHQLKAFSILRAFVDQECRPIVIDSCCGTGLSTTLLAEQYPDHFVIGIDKSEARLSRNLKKPSSNLLFLRADVIDLWRLLAQASLPITHHFLFYPNPWPKANQIKRRFYAHPVFSTMLTLAPYFEMRTNWLIYAEECLRAMGLLGFTASLTMKTDSRYISLFEKKYQAASCPIYIVKN